MVQNGKCTQGEYRKSPSGPCPQPTAPPRGSFLEFVLEQTCKYAHTVTHCSALCHVIYASCPSLLLEHAKHTLPQGLCTTVPSVLLLDIHTAPSLTFFGLGSKVTSLENSPARPLHPPLPLLPCFIFSKALITTGQGLVLVAGELLIGAQ